MCYVRGSLSEVPMHKAGNKEFEVGDLVLKWDHPHDEKGKHTKFQ